MALEAGTIFAGYTIVRWLGSGPMANVYVATHPQTEGQYALKIPTTTRSEDSAFCMRFCRNGAAARNMQHPNLAALQGIGEFTEHVWAAREYVAGTSAADLIRHFPHGIPVQGAADIVSGIGAALDYLHGHGCVHRDVKPSNILLAELESNEPRIALSDFATGCRPGGPTAADLDPAAYTYAAPEEVLSDIFDVRVDQYALAASALHLLTGAPPVSGDLTAVITQLVSAPPPTPSNRRPELAHLDQVFRTALAKNPADRFDSCADFAAALSQASRG